MPFRKKRGFITTSQNSIVNGLCSDPNEFTRHPHSHVYKIHLNIIPDFLNAEYSA